MLKYGRLDVAASLIGADGQVVPGGVVMDADGSSADVARSTDPSAAADGITIA
jgi:hypothetical protein